ncbi:NnrU family protein [Parasphingopyxis sp.]|uniref:NnrU family protein n=1 Tax=Parasphingopyxis sp. TaxID=1920299 RepID=UPI00261D3808|nr:NnrU family protein [Parasphingopyxis sp.]
MDPLTQLIVATIAFVGFHFLLSHPLRAPMVARLGETVFMGVYSLIAAASLGWMVWAARSVPPMPAYWIAPPWFFDWGAPILMLISMILLAGSFLGNPAFPDPTAKSRPVRPVTGVFAITRHPMNWAFIVWAVTHIALSGSPVNLVIATGILILTFFGSMGQDRKKERLMGDAWRGWESRTSFMPFGAIIDGRVPLRAAWPGVVPLVFGGLLWFGASWLHAMPVGPIAWTG